MASPLSGEDEPNPVLWLATWAGKIELPLPLWITRCVLEENRVLFRLGP